MSSLPRFNGERVLVTGASGAIGGAAALTLAAAGAHVVLHGRNLGRLEEIAAQIPHGKSTITQRDFSDADGIPAWLVSLAEKDGPFSGIAHIAGTQGLRALRIMDMKFINSMFQTNTTTALMLAKGFRQRKCHADGASLVLVSSVAAHSVGSGNSGYGASKAAIIGATKALAHELLHDKIRVNCVTPGLVEGPIVYEARRMMPPEQSKAMEDEHILGIGKPEDIAHAIVYMLSDQARWMTGTELVLDGGFSLK